MKGGESGASLAEGFHVFLLVVRGFTLPTLEENANPFEGQAADDGVVGLAARLVILNVVASPLALGHGEPGKLVESLPIKFGAGPAEVDRFAFATAFGDRRDPGEALDVGGFLEALAIGPEGGWRDEELAQAYANNFLPVTLGTRILRGETAALAALSIVQSRLGDLG